ncbi:uncharacterized protein LOC124452675 [Xenia sp. Carnegie-2017]|uniref:uncharacterized protein LOC124452675 n=1 Tax=Xenia sp. Carnegie-2017 TaxID=2897299 RepID=UPI001F03E4C9|nr:uncharacterized protein LOC124452675 [Xenia sp. Carnegie-2017]XP_046859219.1 uncharacterized protein LOC124452675 [Xenia sp. Carnegie-2017]XP_046859220.1 uncharacterized protein LOC124452675 [Xenia sp. Carnegie-2017]
MVAISLIVLFVFINFPEPSENCDTKLDVIYKEYNCNCSIPTNKLPENCTEIRKQITEQYNAYAKDKRENDYGWVYVATIPVGSAGILFNALLILVILCDPLKILHRGAWMTILSLSISDTMACSARVASSVIVKWWDFDLTEKSRIYTEFFWQFGVNGSFLSLTLLTLQTFMIVKYPVKSRLAMSSGRVVFMIGILWVVSLGLALPEIDDISKDTRKYFFVATVSVLEMATLVQIIVKILIIREILSPSEALRSGIQHKYQREVAKTVIILIFILIVTALPYFIAKQIEYIRRIKDGSYNLTIKFPYYYEPIAIANFVANPIVYSFRLRDYRKSLLFLFFHYKKNKNHAPLINQSNKTMVTKV